MNIKSVDEADVFVFAIQTVRTAHDAASVASEGNGLKRFFCTFYSRQARVYTFYLHSFHRRRRNLFSRDLATFSIIDNRKQMPRATGFMRPEIPAVRRPGLSIRLSSLVRRCPSFFGRRATTMTRLLDNRKWSGS